MRYPRFISLFVCVAEAYTTRPLVPYSFTWFFPFAATPDFPNAHYCDYPFAYVSSIRILYSPQTLASIIRFHYRGHLTFNWMRRRVDALSASFSAVHEVRCKSGVTYALGAGRRQLQAGRYRCYRRLTQPETFTALERIRRRHTAFDGLASSTINTNTGEENEG